MTKVATIDTRKVMSLVVAAAMVLATVMALIVPGGVRADTEGSLTGTIYLGQGVITVDSVSVYTLTDNETTSLTPHTAYHIKVGVSNSNTLDDLTTVTVYVFYDSDGTYTPGEELVPDAQATHATFTWTNSSQTFAETGPAGTWACDNSSSVQPTLTAPSGIFEFHITVGDVATQTVNSAKWHIYAVATDGTSPGHNTEQNLTMQWYGAITMNTATVQWSSATPGMVYTASDSPVSVKYVANGHYHKKIEALSSSWLGATLVDSDSPGQQQFALQATDSATLGDAVRLFTSYRDIGESATQTTEAGSQDDSNTIWLNTGTPFTTGMYSGAIYYQISNA